VTILSKPELRARMRNVRRGCAAAAPDAALRAATVLPLERLPAFAVYGGYHALGAELDPRPLIVRLGATGARLALPAAASLRAALEFRAADGELEADGLGIPSPPATAEVLLPDMVIVPLLAFDRRGGRLGQGAGFYDRALASLRALKPVFALGLAYAGQEVEAVPTEPHDQPLDAILTEIGYIDLG